MLIFKTKKQAENYAIKNNFPHLYLYNSKAKVIQCCDKMIKITFTNDKYIHTNLLNLGICKKHGHFLGKMYIKKEFKHPEQKPNEIFLWNTKDIIKHSLKYRNLKTLHYGKIAFDINGNIIDKDENCIPVFIDKKEQHLLK